MCIHFQIQGVYVLGKIVWVVTKFNFIIFPVLQLPTKNCICKLPKKYFVGNFVNKLPMKYFIGNLHT